MKDLFRSLKFASKYKKLTIVNLLLAVLSVCLNLVPPIIFKYFFDLIEIALKSGITEAIRSGILKGSIVYFIFVIVNIIVNRVSMFSWVRWSNETERSLAVDVFEHTQNLSLEYFSQNQTGKLTERFSKGVNSCLRLMEDFLFQLFPQFLFFIIATIILFKYSWYFGLIVGLGIPAYGLITYIFNKKLIKIHDKIRNDYEEIGNIRTETISNIKTVKSYAQEDFQLNKLRKKTNDKYNHNMEWAYNANYMFIFRGIVYYGSQFIAMILGVYLVLNNQITLGTFVLVWSYVSKSFEPMNYIMRIFDNIVRELRTVKRLFELLDTEPSVKDVKNAKNLKFKEGKIEFDKVNFKYEDEEKSVIKDFSLTIPAKSIVAIIGKSGSGKTTLTKLLLRFYDLNKGQILIDGQDIAKVKQKGIRENISYVLQDSSLFNDTVINNIKFGCKKNISLEKVIRASKVANAFPFIDKLPKKFETLVGERGVKLSGGEQQRINIARAIIKDTPILVLDEATSSLDSESEQLIQNALWKLIKGRTTIIIAHRLSTVMKADIIVVMDKGKIVETGTHRDLVQKKGIYSKLFEIQSGGYLEDDIQKANI